MMKNQKRKHCIKKILSFLTITCCLAANMAPLAAQAESGAASEENPRIVFTNEPVEEANLNVFKLVENADGGEVPEEEADTEFEFKLKLNSSAANQVIYHLYNGSVQEENEVFKEGGSTDKHKTKRDGTFYLKAGQVAVFRSEDNPLVMGENVIYSVTEEGPVLSEKAKSYQLLKSENAQGSIKKNGATAIFTNEYIPNGAGNEARIDVVKTVPFAEGCRAPETPDFTFLLKLNNKACGNTPYEIIDNETQEKIGEGGTTDANGIFTLKGGQTARFTRYKGQKIKTGVQYEVMELDLPAGWRVAGDNGAPEGTVLEIGSESDKVTYTVAASEAGSTIPITRAYFSNISASFGVSKFVEGSEKPDIDFTFELTHADRSAWPGASYYLYNGTGNLIPNEADDAPEDGSFSTDEKGRFPLKHGQTAVFYGIAAGEKYNVKEVRIVPDSPAPQDADSQEPGNEKDKVIYVQSKPDDPEGYTDNKVSNTAPVWEFRNKPSAGGLTVTKAVTNLSGESAFREVDFSFTLWERKELPGKDSEGNPQYEWKPVENEPFQRNGVDDGETTKAGGSFTLKPNGTVAFPYLENGYYRVVEDLTGVQEYTPANPDKDSEGKDLATQTVEGEYKAGSTVEFAFENLYEAWKFDLRLVKEDGEGKSLEGAEFKLYYLDPKEGAASKNDDHLQGTYTTAGDGRVTIGNLKAGTYILEEARAPSGYALLFDAITLEVIRTENGISVVLDGGNADSDIVKVTGKKLSDSNESDWVEITVYNTRLYELPSAGGRGIYWYSAGGMLLMMAAALVLYKYKLAGEVLKD